MNKEDHKFISETALCITIRKSNAAMARGKVWNIAGLGEQPRYQTQKLLPSWFGLEAVFKCDQSFIYGKVGILYSRLLYLNAASFEFEKK